MMKIIIGTLVVCIIAICGIILTRPTIIYGPNFDDEVLYSLTYSYSESKNVVIGTGEPTDVADVMEIVFRLSHFPRYFKEYTNGFNYEICITNTSLRLKLIHLEPIKTEVHNKYECRESSCTKTITNFNRQGCILTITGVKDFTDNYNMDIKTDMYRLRYRSHYNLPITEIVPSINKGFIVGIPTLGTHYYYENYGSEAHFIDMLRKKCISIDGLYGITSHGEVIIEPSYEEKTTIPRITHTKIVGFGN